jgi:hypothetical protein
MTSFLNKKEIFAISETADKCEFLTKEKKHKKIERHTYMEEGELKEKFVMVGSKCRKEKKNPCKFKKEKIPELLLTQEQDRTLSDYSDEGLNKKPSDDCLTTSFHNNYENFNSNNTYCQSIQSMIQSQYSINDSIHCFNNFNSQRTQTESFSIGSESMTIGGVNNPAAKDWLVPCLNESISISSELSQKNNKREYENSFLGKKTFPSQILSPTRRKINISFLNDKDGSICYNEDEYNPQHQKNQYESFNPNFVHNKMINDTKNYHLDNIKLDYYDPDNDIPYLQPSSQHSPINQLPYLKQDLPPKLNENLPSQFIRQHRSLVNSKEIKEKMTKTTKNKKQDLFLPPTKIRKDDLLFSEKSCITNFKKKFNMNYKHEMEMQKKNVHCDPSSHLDTAGTFHFNNEVKKIISKEITGKSLKMPNNININLIQNINNAPIYPQININQNIMPTNSFSSKQQDFYSKSYYDFSNSEDLISSFLSYNKELTDDSFFHI